MRPAVLIGGFGVPARSMEPLARSLRTAGWATTIAPTGLNIGCGEATVADVERVVEATAASAGYRVAVVGHSRGGQFARVVAVRRPELVTTVVTVATPWTMGPPARPGVDAASAVLRALRSKGVDLM